MFHTLDTQESGVIHCVQISEGHKTLTGAERTAAQEIYGVQESSELVWKETRAI